MNLTDDGNGRATGFAGEATRRSVFRRRRRNAFLEKKNQIEWL
jgi:hypothetical protein